MVSATVSFFSNQLLAAISWRTGAINAGFTWRLFITKIVLCYSPNQSQETAPDWSWINLNLMLPTFLVVKIHRFIPLFKIPYYLEDTGFIQSISKKNTVQHWKVPVSCEWNWWDINIKTNCWNQIHSCGSICDYCYIQFLLRKMNWVSLSKLHTIGVSLER